MVEKWIHHYRNPKIETLYKGANYSDIVSYFYIDKLPTEGQFNHFPVIMFSTRNGNWKYLYILPKDMVRWRQEKLAKELLLIVKLMG